MNEQFTFVSSCHLFYLMRSYAIFTGKSAAYKFFVTLKAALNSYQGLSALGKFFFVCIKFDKGGNSLPKHFERIANIHSNL